MKNVSINEPQIKKTCSTSFLTKQTIFELHELAAHRLNDTVKYKGFSDSVTLRYLKKLPSADIPSLTLTDIQFCLLWFILVFI